MHRQRHESTEMNKQEKSSLPTMEAPIKSGYGDVTLGARLVNVREKGYGKKSWVEFAARRNISSWAMLRTAMNFRTDPEQPGENRAKDSTSSTAAVCLPAAVL